MKRKLEEEKIETKSNLDESIETSSLVSQNSKKKVRSSNAGASKKKKEPPTYQKMFID